MNTLVIDLTHGGVKIAVSLAKKGDNVYCYDIYNTLKDIEKRMLDVYNIELIQLDDLKKFNDDLKVIYPIHLPLSNNEIKEYSNKAFNSTLNGLGFSRTIYNDNNAQLIFNDNIELKGLKDNLGRDVSEIYLTIIHVNPIDIEKNKKDTKK